MKYVVPEPEPDPKSLMTDITDQPELIAALEAHPMPRIVRKDGRVGVYTTDLRKFRGEDVEINL